MNVETLCMTHTPLKRLLFERDMTVRELSERTGIVYGTLREVVNGRVPTLENAIKIARTLGETVEGLWGYVVETEKRPDVD